MRIAVGAPVHQRAWVLPAWMNAIRAQRFDGELHLVFVYGASTDATLEMLLDASDWAHVTVLHEHQEAHVAERRWSFERYEAMARMRNRMLRRVRELDVDVFVSCDTDILLPPGAVDGLLRGMALGYDGVSPLTYMQPSGTGAPNAMTLGGNRRPALQASLFTVDACFGCVAMNRALYHVDYEAHRQGEDIGWAQRARRAGLKLGLDPRIKAKHVMKVSMLFEHDERVGF